MADRPFAEVKRLIFVAAHPDDLETIAGGAIYQMTQRGVEVIEVLCTDGNIGTHEVEKFTRKSLARIRRKETRAAAKVLGIKEVVFLGHDDGELEPSLELRAALAQQYRSYQPDSLMTFDPYVGGHPDHRAAGRAATDALIPASMPLYRKKQLKNGVKPGDRDQFFARDDKIHRRFASPLERADLLQPVRHCQACEGREDLGGQDCSL